MPRAPISTTANNFAKAASMTDMTQDVALVPQEQPPSELDKFRAAVSQDLALHHRMLFELHQRVRALEDERPQIQIARDLPPSATAAAGIALH